MNRREFLRRSAIIAAGVIAADQLELLERLSPRRLFPGADFTPIADSPFGPLVTREITTTAELDRLIKEVYSQPLYSASLGDMEFFERGPIATIDRVDVKRKLITLNWKLT